MKPLHNHSARAWAFKDTVKFIITRNFIVFLLAALVITMTVNYKILEKGLQARTLNHLMPNSFEYLVDPVEADKPFDLNELMKYEFYFQKLDEFIPEQADTKGMLGFCNFYLNRPQRAIAFYLEAVKLKPDYFWFKYNLGVVYYIFKDYKSAAQYLYEAVQTRPDHAVAFIEKSNIVYKPVLKHVKIDEPQLRARLSVAYYRSYLLLIECLKRLNKTDRISLFKEKADKIKSSLSEDDLLKYPMGVRLF